MIVRNVLSLSYSYILYFWKIMHQYIKYIFIAVTVIKYYYIIKTD